jgi:hypothetical protein
VMYFRNPYYWDNGKSTPIHKGSVPYTVHCRVGKEEYLHRARFSRVREHQTICRFTVGAGGKVTEVKFGAGATSPKAAKKATAPVATTKKSAKKAAKKAAPVKKARVTTARAAGPAKKPAVKRAAAPKKKTAVPAKKAAKKASATKAANKKK